MIHDLALTVSHTGNWIIDPGASQHICSNGENIGEGTYKEISERVIEIADGSRIEAIETGDICIEQLQLARVLHIPRAGRSLLSVGRLIDSVFKVSFEPPTFIIAHPTIRVEGERDGNLDYLATDGSIEKESLGLATNKATP